ncbi:MAG: secondary thiamine-phosphate synthase enzyme YjbQ [Caldilineaceae bacterium]
MVITNEIHLDCKGYCDMHDITTQVAQAVANSGVRNGIVVVFTPSATSSITTTEHEPGMVADFQAFFERVASQAWEYKHNEYHRDGNGFSHVRSALLGPSISAPILDSQLLLGKWQKITFIDFDNRERQRRIVVQMVGE